MIDTSALPGQLTKWTVLVSACALPSFIIALVFGFHTPHAIAGMLCGIATFIVAYALVTSTHFYLRRSEGLLGRALRAGTKVRVIISLFSLPLLIGLFSPKAGFALQIMPDFWCGFAAIKIVDKLGSDFSLITDQQQFFPAYLTTVVEGILMSLTLAALCLLALWPISMRPTPEHHPGAAK